MNPLGGFELGIFLGGKTRNLALKLLIFFLNREGKGEQGLQEVAVRQCRSRRPHAHAMTAAKDSFVVARQITPAASCLVDRKKLWRR